MRTALIALASLSLGALAQASPADFTPGPVITEFGAVAEVSSADPLPADVEFKVAFDIAKAAEPGEVNRQLNSAARFINMHAAAGVPADRIHIAVVVHGPAASDLLISEENANAPLIAALIAAGVDIILCGQTAAYRDIQPEQLLPGVTLSLSAMTAHALLQQNGYTLNPF